MLVTKRNGNVVPFDAYKIENAIQRGLKKIGVVDTIIPKAIANEATVQILGGKNKETIHVDEIHRIVENVIMSKGLHDLAREYITYRFQNKQSVFKKRANLKPYEYPELIEYVNAIRHSYWIHTEFNYSSDIQDLKVNLTQGEANIIKNAMLAIAQIELQVKTFWAKIGDRLPKPEIQAVGVTFAESEVRHTDAYSTLLELAGLNDEFKTLVQVPAIKKRIEYLDKSIQTPIDDKDYFKNIILFSMFVENVSLFSQFLIMMSFNKHKNVLKGISNAVEATSKEEDIHAKFGFDIVNIIKQENTGWFNEIMIDQVIELVKQAYEAEAGIVDWIYGNIDLDFLPKAVVKEFVKDRFNQSMRAIGLENVFEVNTEMVKQTAWFAEEMLSTKNVDFFVKRSTAYSKKTKSFTEDDLF
jgi:ribonucleoside-diphosphate reductase beta chain